VVVYATSSVDGTNYSEDTTGNAQLMAFVGAVSMAGTPTAPGWRSRAFSLAAAFGGTVPPKWKLVFLNDNSTTALNSTGNSVQYRGVSAQSV
jgi:hypothetical protein